VAGRRALLSWRNTKEYARPTAGLGWLRLICAALVIFDHSSAIAVGQGVPMLPGSWGLAPGDLALAGLFMMSGYQVSGSWDRDPSWWRFSARRLLRLLPPLLFVLMVTVFIVGPLLTSWTQTAYWSHPQTWRYLVGSSVIMLMQHNLPGVFWSNPYPWSVNGSLWTLPMEFASYGLLLVAGVVIAVGVPRVVVLIPLLGGIFVLDTLTRDAVANGGTVGSWLAIPLSSLVTFMVPFILGMVFYAWRDRIPLLRLPALALLVGWFEFRTTPIGMRYLLPVMVTYCSLVLVHHWPKRLSSDGAWIRGNYGMYLWGFLVQQLIAAAGVRNPWVLAAIAIPASYLCGVLSWTFIEKPTQRLTKYLRGAPSRPAVNSPQRELQLQG
jgi:peptidoglycan/LPS O-acetylase OafA/YrhL